MLLSLHSRTCGVHVEQQAMFERDLSDFADGVDDALGIAWRRGRQHYRVLVDCVAHG